MRADSTLETAADFARRFHGENGLPAVFAPGDADVERAREAATQDGEDPAVVRAGWALAVCSPGGRIGVTKAAASFLRGFRAGGRRR